jgi:hypothetical protein
MCLSFSYQQSDGVVDLLLGEATLLEVLDMAVQEEVA